MKKLVCIGMTALVILFTLAGCSTESTVSSDNAGSTSMNKVVVNFEGTVTAVNGDEITLENGKIVVISSDTVFAGDPDTNNEVREEIIVGNFMQGYTEDDPDSEQVSADKIYYNAAAR
ncbi:MAG: hypothetical protein J6K48_03455 [Lachnospiraceae bacterium]|nr:hypothetical protein [Lachnospiraceae bacterium]